jgi:hypothetical protein
LPTQVGRLGISVRRPLVDSQRGRPISVPTLTVCRSTYNSWPTVPAQAGVPFRNIPSANQ